MDKIKLGAAQAALLLCVVAVCLIALRYVPSFNVLGYDVKPVDMLADVMPEAALDSASLLADVGDVAVDSAAAGAKVVPRDTFPPGMTGIENYETVESDTCFGMTKFYSALASMRELGRPVRIAYFGDSFIEGDILTADLRELLQSKFGGCGVGFVDISSPFTKLRTSVTHKANGWTEHNVLEKKRCDRSRLGITGRYAVGSGGASVCYGGVKAYAHLDTFEVATLYLAPQSSVEVAVSANGSSVGTQRADDGSHIAAMKHEGRMGSVRYNITSGSATAYGVALEGRSGVVVDNFSLRGSSGMQLASIPMSHLSQLYALRPYDLVVLQYGLNVAAKGQLKYGTYTRQMKKVIEHFKQAFPHSSILLVSVGDRENRENGTLRTMSAIKALVNYQHNMAAEEGIAFWNMYEAMGGEGAISRMANAKPAEAERDYTHINRRGGKSIAGKLFRSLTYGYEQYLKRRKQ